MRERGSILPLRVSRMKRSMEASKWPRNDRTPSKMSITISLLVKSSQPLGLMFSFDFLICFVLGWQRRQDLDDQKVGVFLFYFIFRWAICTTMIISHLSIFIKYNNLSWGWQRGRKGNMQEWRKKRIIV